MARYFAQTRALTDFCGQLSDAVLQTLREHKTDTPAILLVAAGLIVAYAHAMKQPIKDCMPFVLALELERDRVKRN